MKRSPVGNESLTGQTKARTGHALASLRRVLALTLLGLTVGACQSLGAIASAAPATTSSPTITASPVDLQTALVTPSGQPVEPSPGTPGTADARLTCGGRTFPASGLDASTGAENATGPEFDALRATLAKFGSEFEGSSEWTWRLAGRDDTGAVFLARVEALGPPGWVAVEVTADLTGWHAQGMGQCDPRVVLSAEFGPATWALDPAFAAPTADSTELHILVWELACSSGMPTTGRMSAPVVRYAAETVTITIGVRRLDGMQTCPGPPGTPDVVRLPDPLGRRTLLDGGHVPPAPPSPPF